ncbi:inositol 2-dehydrogenase [Dolosicoccus paucivorans]|uniref:inositol 2-dehydrogenase n=1 Tax=Dolosicoccus paucivorans TaxID=84521 RepID=UPI000C7F7AC9|nr:inositol 2-dehydrogenase [Dolosicoccus paucivorans]PMB83587.1 inositol 2-dehydrogenase [Dolosicoccus paucivorans]
MEKVRLGIVGLGRLGKTHARNLVSEVPGCELVAACSVVEEELEFARKNLGVKKTYNSYDDLISDDEIDAVVIVSPSGMHCEQITKAFEAGKHVFSEKPLGLEMDEMERVKEVIESRPDQKFMLGFMRRFDPSYQYAKELVEKGEIGKISFIRAYGIDPSTGMESFVKFAKTNPSGGLFLDMAVHDIDLIRWYTGSEFDQVWAVGNNIAYPELDEAGELETGSALATMKDGSFAIMVSGRNAAHGYHVETEIYGTEGSLRIANIQEKNLVSIYNADGAVRPISQNFPERFQQAFVNEMKEFVKIIREDLPSPINPEDGIQATKVALACGKALETNQVTKI